MRFWTAVILVLMVWALPSAAAQAASPEPASVAATAAAKKRALKKALKKCRAIKKVNRRKACARKARKRFAKKPSKPKKPVAPKPGKTWRVDVVDDYFVDLFSPDYLEIKSGDRIEWVWSDMNQNPHNVTLESGPEGVNRTAYRTPNSPSRNYRWSRQLVETGTWNFVCSLHHLMKMTVKVEK